MDRDDEIVPQQNWALYSGLSLGVTTIHDPSNDTTEILPLPNNKPIVGPRISTGTILYGANAPWLHIAHRLHWMTSTFERLTKSRAFRRSGATTNHAKSEAASHRCTRTLK